MNSAYELKHLENPVYPFIVYSTSYYSPTEFLEDIAKDLQTYQYRGKILFDLLLSNGDAPNRFIEAWFDGAELDITSFKIVHEDLEDIKQVSLEFYRQHPEMLKRSVLSISTQFEIWT